MEGNIEAFTCIPNIKELQCMIYESYPSDSHTSLLVHCNETCRFILTEVPNVLVAPNYINSTIYVISTKSTHRLGKLNRIPNTLMKINFLDVQILTSEIYEMCLTYSLLNRVSPEWIKIDKYYARSHKFIKYEEQLNAVEVNVKYWEKSLQLKLSAVTVGISPYFEPKTCTPRCWKYFNESTTGFINLSLSQQVYCMPSLRKGTIVSVCKTIGQHSIREYWLNQHGYILPDLTELSYCKVRHSDSENDISIYPSICLLAKPLHVAKNNNCRKTIANFLKVFIRKNITICGMAVELMGRRDYESRGMKPIELHVNSVEKPEKANSDVRYEEPEKAKSDFWYEEPEKAKSDVRYETPGKAKSDVRFEWEECDECSREAVAGTQNFDTVVTIPFDLDSVKGNEWSTTFSDKSCQMDHAYAKKF